METRLLTEKNSQMDLNLFLITFQGGDTQELVKREITEVPEKYSKYGMFGKLPAKKRYAQA